MDTFDVYIGVKPIDETEFITSRCEFLGSFILGFTRGMIYEICEIAMPNRYNVNGLNEQPYIGDTDSLLFRKW